MHFKLIIHAQNLGQTQTLVPRVSFSIKPDVTMTTRRNSHLIIFWQVRDELCLAERWRLIVATRNQTLLSYPKENMSNLSDDYSDYNVSAVPGMCESDGQEINVTLTIFISENVDIDEYVFCKIRISDPDSNNTSMVYFVLENMTTTDSIMPTTSTTVTVTETPTTDYTQPNSTSSVAHTKGILYALLISVILALLFH